MADIATYKIQFKSDFVLTIHGDAGWTTPFCIKFWTGAPTIAYFVGFDGTEYRNCRLGDTPDSLVVLFDDHHLPVGDLTMQMAYHTTIEEFPSVEFDEVTNPEYVVTNIDGQEYHVMLDFTGEMAPEIQFSLPAYANEAQRIANEQERERIFAEMQQAFATMQRESGAATAGAENVNATLNGTTLTVTDRTGHQTSSNVQGPPGPPGSGVQADWSETDPSADDYIKNKPTIPTVPTNVSAFTNDAGYITKSVNDLVNYYLKQDVYTKTEVANLIAAIQQFHYEIYASISVVTTPAGNVLYLIGPTGSGSDKYEEYVYDATKQEPWVKIGDTSIDLSGYYTSAETDTAISTALNTALADYTTTAALTLLLAGKQDSLTFNTAPSSSNKVATMADMPTVMHASGSGHKGGLVPDTPSSAGTAKFLREDGTWAEPATGDGTSYVPTLNAAPTSSTTTYTKDGQTVDFEIGQFARVAKQGGGYDFYQLYDLQTENNVTATWVQVGELPSNVAYISSDSGVGIVPEDGIRAETVTSAAAMTVNPDVVTVINGAVGTAAITLQVPNDNLAHVWDILMTTDSTVAITFAMSNSATILYPNGFSVGAGKAVEISVIGVGTKYYLRYGEFA